MTTASGEVREAFVRSSRGGLDSPLNDDELGLKFELNAGRSLAREQVAALREAVAGLDRAPTLDQLVRHSVVR